MCGIVCITHKFYGQAGHWNPGGGGIIGGHFLFDKITSIENLFLAWRQFRRGKRSKLEVQEFEFNLEENLFQLTDELANGTYTHLDYTSFYVNDPKLRHIHKAYIRDRIVHHAVHNILYPIFDEQFVYDSYSCRLDRGTHRAVSRLEKFIRQLGANNTKPVYYLKCDIRKFFDSVSHTILLDILKRYISDNKTLGLIENIIDSFNHSPSCGLPLGNLTSQLLGNIYLNELDQFIKHGLKIKYYLRYCDDFIILSNDPMKLQELIPRLAEFLEERLSLELHPRKIFLNKHRRGIDFLGYVVLPYHRVLRTRTKRRLMRKINRDNQSSYLGILKHCNGYNIEQSQLVSLSHVRSRVGETERKSQQAFDAVT